MNKLYYYFLTRGCALDIRPLSYFPTKLFDHFIGDRSVQLYVWSFARKNKPMSGLECYSHV